MRPPGLPVLFRVWAISPVDTGSLLFQGEPGFLGSLGAQKCECTRPSVCLCVSAPGFGEEQSDTGPRPSQRVLCEGSGPLVSEVQDHGEHIKRETSNVHKQKELNPEADLGSSQRPPGGRACPCKKALKAATEGANYLYTRLDRSLHLNGQIP
ncbi:hypothetical protein DPEC_G00153540 [Dallia pectoralis]|uniref:Uncharacterized protein n=1 Tax=Dallia pectoralis TaxID=75939 RepID=A0ACC2GJY0_DALPE|nr:hypothetical protein DPEC_G00153540 [Dallia pectoralis]